MKVEAVATFPDEFKVIRNVQQRVCCSLAIRKRRYAGKRSTICEKPLCGSVDGHYVKQTVPEVYPKYPIMRRLSSRRGLVNSVLAY